MNIKKKCRTRYPCLILYDIWPLHFTYKKTVLKSVILYLIKCLNICSEPQIMEWQMHTYMLLSHNISFNEKYTFKEWVSFFLGSWWMNRSAGQTNRVNREAVLGRFVCSALRFIPHEPRKKDTHSLYLQCFQLRSFLKLSKKSYKFKISAVTGT